MQPPLRHLITWTLKEVVVTSKDDVSILRSMGLPSKDDILILKDMVSPFKRVGLTSLNAMSRLKSVDSVSNDDAFASGGISPSCESAFVWTYLFGRTRPANH